jgi:GntR family transcriptional regulator
MIFRINRTADFPIFQQLKEQIKYFLLNGDLQAGDKMPTPLELEQYLGINRNTVIVAYKELEKEGLLVSRRGQGTFVTDRINHVKGPDMRELFELARDTVEKTKQLGYDVEDLFTIIYNQTVLNIDAAHKPILHALLIECNTPDLNYYCELLKNELKIYIDICLLSELQERLHSNEVKNADFVITSFSHLEDAKAILEPLGKEVLGFMAAPHLQTFMRIARLDAGTRVGLVCATEDGASSMKRALENAGITHVALQSCGTGNAEKLRSFLCGVDIVVSSRVAFETVEKVIPAGMAVVEFFPEPDRGGLEMLKQYVRTKMSFNRSGNI